MAEAKIPKIVADFETQISGAIAVSDTSFTLNSVTDSDGNTLANGEYCFTIDRNNSDSKEYLFGTLDNSTKTVSSVVSVSRQGVSTSGAQNTHRIGANVIVSDHSALVGIAGVFTGDTIPEDNPLKYTAQPTLTDDNELATKLYVDNAGGGYTGNNKVLIAGNAGETIAAGNLIYFNTADQEWYKADADTSYGEDVQFGVAQGSGTDGNAITTGILLRGLDENQTGMTAGATQYISTTAGELTESAPTNDIFAGVALSATDVLINFENRITEYLSTADATNGGVDDSQTTSTNTIEVGEANATTKKNSLAQQFVPTEDAIRSVRLYKKADTGSFTGTVTISIQADSSGAPSGSALATVTITNAEWLALQDDAEFEAIFDSEYGSLTIGDTYWIDVQPSTSDNSNHPNLGADTSGGSGGAYYNNTTDGWVQIANADLYFKTIKGIEDKVVKSQTSGYIDRGFIPMKFGFGQVNDASATTFTHNLGITPRYIELNVIQGGEEADSNISVSVNSIGVYDVLNGTYTHIDQTSQSDSDAATEDTQWTTSSNTNRIATIINDSGAGVSLAGLTVTSVTTTTFQISAPSNLVGTARAYWKVWG